MHVTSSIFSIALNWKFYKVYIVQLFQNSKWYLKLKDMSLGWKRTFGSRLCTFWCKLGLNSYAILYSPLTKFWSQRPILETGYALQISAFESLLLFINLRKVFSDTAMSPKLIFSNRLKEKFQFTNYCLINLSTLAFISITEVFVLNKPSIITIFTFQSSIIWLFCLRPGLKSVLERSWDS